MNLSPAANHQIQPYMRNKSPEASVLRLGFTPADESMIEVVVGYF
jgi:hypothetical protein